MRESLFKRYPGRSPTIFNWSSQLKAPTWWSMIREARIDILK